MVGYNDKKVLVVENSKVVSGIIKKALVASGINSENITTATDGHQALLIAELVDFSLVTTAVHMKLKDGAQLLEGLRKNAKKESLNKMPVIVISSETDLDYAQKFLDLGIQGFIKKPFKTEDIQNSVRQILGAPDSSEEPDGSGDTSEDSAISQDFIKAFTDSAFDALGQYMVTADISDPLEEETWTSYFSSNITLTNKDHNIRISISLYFPQKVACDIYAGIFGEVDMEQVNGVVQELGNIIGGIVRPKITGFSSEIYELAHGSTEGIDEDTVIHFDLGLPEGKMGDEETKIPNDCTKPKFIVPFSVDEERFIYMVQIEKNLDD
jgi:two-component system, chemotaxis family, chemotaxis protein CheY